MTQVRKPSYQVSKEKKKKKSSLRQLPAESSSAQACEIPLMAAPTPPTPHPPIRFSRPPLTPTHTSVQGTKRRIKITKKLKQNVLVFGVSSVESLGEAVLNSSPSWAAGGRPRGSFFFFLLCVCGLREDGEGGVWTQVGEEGGEGWEGVEGLCSGSRPLLSPPPPADSLRLTGCFLLSSQERAGGGWLRGFFREVILLALSLERARQFVKAFGERGGNLHVT